MFSKILVFVILGLVLFTAGCVSGIELPQLSLFGMDFFPSGPYFITIEILKVDVEPIPSEVRGGNNVTLFFDVANDGNTTLSNVNVKMTDLCEFEKQTDIEKTIEILEPQEIESWTWKLKAKEVPLGRDCTLRYVTSYNSHASAYYDVSIISEEEYVRLKRKGTLEQEIFLYYYKTKSPVDIDISLSTSQPILEETDFYLYIKFKDVGGGFIEKINSGDLVIKYPTFITNPECNDFSIDEKNNTITLNRNLSFLNKETKICTCKFKTGAGLRDISQFKVKLNYKYIYYNSLNIKIKPK